MQKGKGPAYRLIEEWVGQGFPLVAFATGRKAVGEESITRFLSYQVKRYVFNWFYAPLTVDGAADSLTLYVITATPERKAELFNYAGCFFKSLGIPALVKVDPENGVFLETGTSRKEKQGAFLASSVQIEKLPDYLSVTMLKPFDKESLLAGSLEEMPYGNMMGKVLWLSNYRLLEVATEKGLDFCALPDGPEMEELETQCFKDAYYHRCDPDIDVQWKKAALELGTFSSYYREGTDMHRYAKAQEVGKGLTVEKIYLDMDGVLADFTKGASQAFGSRDYTDDEMWEAVRKVPNFFNTLELMPDAKALFDALYGKYGDRVEILTAVPKEKRGIPTAEADKVAWMHRELSEKVVVNAVKSAKDKQLFCKGQGTILIDDWKPNIRQWRQAGGLAIRCTDCATVMERLKEYGIL